MNAAIRELLARVSVKLWAWSYALEERRELAAREQRNLACAGYCLLLAACGGLERRT